MGIKNVIGLHDWLRERRARTLAAGDPSSMAEQSWPLRTSTPPNNSLMLTRLAGGK